MSEQKIDEKRLAEIEARAKAKDDAPSGVCMCGSYTKYIYGHDGHSIVEASECQISGPCDETLLVADLRAARAEIERLKGEADRRVAEEREACAAIAHQVASEWDGEPGNGAALACERRIRARGES